MGRAPRCDCSTRSAGNVAGAVGADAVGREHHARAWPPDIEGWSDGRWGDVGTGCANGERKEALRKLAEIVKAENEAIEIASKMKQAANLRSNAWLGLNNKDHGEESVERVIERFEEITALDPGASWDWITLAELYREHERLTQKA